MTIIMTEYFRFNFGIMNKQRYNVNQVTEDIFGKTETARIL